MRKRLRALERLAEVRALMATQREARWARRVGELREVVERREEIRAMGRAEGERALVCMREGEHLEAVMAGQVRDLAAWRAEAMQSEEQRCVEASDAAGVEMRAAVLAREQSVVRVRAEKKVLAVWEGRREQAVADERFLARQYVAGARRAG